MRNGTRILAMAATLAAAAAAGPATATEIVYRPINPSFGGDPLNGSTLLNAASQQNDFSDPRAGQLSTQSSINQFQENLQRAILNRIATAVSGSIVDSSGNLIPGTVTIGSFTVTVADLGTTLRITTTDGATGQTSVFEIPK